jgi:DNA transposition AAA+ family ATPase
MPLDQQIPSGGDTRDARASAPQVPVIDRVQAELRSSGLSQAQLAREIDVSPTVISQLFKGQYPGDTAGMVARLSTWLDGRAARGRTEAAVGSVDRYVPTPTSKKILSALKYAHELADVAVVCGGAGAGKTSTVEHYRGQATAVFVFTANPTCAGLNPFLDRLSVAVGVRDPQSRTPAALFQEVADRLALTRGLLVIDEAQHLSVPSLEALRSIHDTTRIGLALLGNELVYDRLHGGRMTQNFAQLFSRVGMVVRLTRPVDGDVDPLARAHGFADQGCLDYLRARAREPGALRGVVKCMRFARVLAAGADQQPSIEHLQLAWAQLERPSALPAGAVR